MRTETDTPDPKRWLAPFLQKLGVTSFEANLSGGGDSGQIDDLTYFSGDQILKNETVEEALAALSVDDGSARPQSFLDALQIMVETDAANEGDYCNNEGGSVWSQYVLNPETGKIELAASSFAENEMDYDEDEEDEEWDPFADDDDPDEEEPDDDVEP